MAVSRCPSCGDLYVAAAVRCADCDVELEPVGSDPAEAADDLDVDAGTEVRELHTWTSEDRRLLDGLLERAGIVRAWQGAELHTRPDAAERVDELVAAVAAAGETVGYEVADWSGADRERLAAALDAAGIEWAWDDDGDLAVSSADEERVDALFDELTAAGHGPDDAGAGDGADAPAAHDELAEEDDGLAVQQTLSDLFVAADRLKHQPLDGTAIRMLRDAAATATGLGLPYGFPAAVWRRVVETAADLSARFEPVELDEDAIRAEAADLRALLREYV
ncbi:MAG TPA: hypothetical protein VK866_17270 [Acidimicrobiales bacterium]|nr:hypothetical protein [Acidimicrobiales bacterium]